MRGSIWAIIACAALSVAPAAFSQQPAYHVVSKIALADGGWDLASFDPVTRRLYLARTDAVTAVDVDSGAVTDKLAAADHAHAVVPLNRGAELLVTNGATNSVRLVDARTGAQLADLPDGQKPDAALFEPASNLAVVVNGASGDLSLIDPLTRKIVGDIPIDVGLEIAASDGQGLVFVNMEEAGALAVVDVRARKVAARIPLTGCQGPTGIAYLPIAKRVISSCANGKAAVVDPAAGKVVDLLDIGQGPDTVIYDSRRRLAFVPAGRSGELDIFADEAGGVRPLGKIATQVGARTGAVDEKTGRLYLPAADYLPPATPGGRPQIKPGSVVLVVVGP